MAAIRSNSFRFLLEIRIRIESKRYFLFPTLANTHAHQMPYVSTT